MVNGRIGQSTLEFIVVLSMLTLLAFALGIYFSPGALPSNAQDIATAKINTY